MVSLDYLAIEGQAFQSEGNGLMPWSGPHIKFVVRTAGKNAGGEPSTQDSIEAVRFCAFAPPGSPLDGHSVVSVVEEEDKGGGASGCGKKSVKDSI